VQNLEQHIRSKKAQLGGFAKRGNKIRAAKAERELKLLMLEKHIRATTSHLTLTDAERNHVVELLFEGQVAHA
jgi:hypothetical protein